MRPNPAWLAAALFLFWIPWQGAAQAQDTPAEARIVIFEGPSGEAQAAPRILRGSAIKPKPAPEDISPLAQAQIASGRRLWLVDRASGQLLACERNFGVDVGSRFIRCTPGLLPVPFSP